MHLLPVDISQLPRGCACALLVPSKAHCEGGEVVERERGHEPRRKGCLRPCQRSAHPGTHGGRRRTAWSPRGARWILGRELPVTDVHVRPPSRSNRSQPATGVEAITVEAGRNLTLQQGLGHWTTIQRTGSRTHPLLEQVRRRSNMLHHVGRARRGLEPLMTFCLARAQVVLFCVALQPRKLCHAQERVPRRLSLAQSRLDVGLRDLPST